MRTHSNAFTHTRPLHSLSDLVTASNVYINPDLTAQEHLHQFALPEELKLCKVAREKDAFRILS